MAGDSKLIWIKFESWVCLKCTKQRGLLVFTRPIKNKTVKYSIIPTTVLIPYCFLCDCVAYWILGLNLSKRKLPHI